MEAKFVFGLLSFAFSAAAYYPYYKQIKNGDAHPTISTWLCWLAIDSTILAAMVIKHQVAYQMVAYTLGVLVVLIACIQAKAPLGWWWLDTVCIVLVGVAIVGWTQSGAEIAIEISAAAFLISCAPMFINIYHKPECEPFWPWLISWTGACFGMLAIPRWDITNALVPTVFFILGMVVILLIVRKVARRNVTL